MKPESLGMEPAISMLVELSGDVKMLPGLRITELPLSGHFYRCFLGESLFMPVVGPIQFSICPGFFIHYLDIIINGCIKTSQDGFG